MIPTRFTLRASYARLLPRAIVVRPRLQPVRFAANTVSNKPPSDDFPHFLQNVKEESSNAAGSLAQAISGGAQTTQFGSTTKTTPINSGFMGYTSAIAATVPPPIMKFGLAGSIPYIGTSAASVYYAWQAGLVATGASTAIDFDTALDLMNQAMMIQTTYGAVMLSFLGALHWGMEFAAFGGPKGAPRLALGVAPTLVAWSTLALEPTIALVVQWVGFTTLWYADMRTTTAGWSPAWFSQYRFYLSLLVGTCIVGTLAGTSALGPGQHGETETELKRLRAKETEETAKVMAKPVAPGEVGSVSGAEENAEAYVLLRRAKDPEEEKQKKEHKEKLDKEEKK